jgi:DNA-binding beta-propeller fold protein YncE
MPSQATFGLAEFARPVRRLKCVSGLSACFFCLSFVCGFAIRQVSAQTPELLVVNQGDANLSIVDPVAMKQVATIPEGVPAMFGHEVATSPDGRLAYLPLYGDSGVGRPGSDGDKLLVIDLASRRIVNQLTFPHGVRPHCIVYDRSSNLLYVTTELDKAIAVIDPGTLKIVGSVSTGQEQSHMLAISHDGLHGYTANVGPGTVSVLDLKSRKLVTTISIATNIQRISISNDDRMVFTSDQAKPRMAVIDTATNTIKQWVDLPAPGYGSASTKDGRELLITLPTTGELAVVDLATMKVARTLKIGPKPQEVLVRPDGLFAYVSCFNSDLVQIIDLKTWQIIKTIEAGQKADGMAWAGN